MKGWWSIPDENANWHLTLLRPRTRRLILDKKSFKSSDVRDFVVECLAKSSVPLTTNQIADLLVEARQIALDGAQHLAALRESTRHALGSLALNEKVRRVGGVGHASAWKANT
jgi:hypothetical protein